MATPADNLIYGTEMTPGEGNIPGHNYIWSPTQGQWIDVTALQEGQQTTTTTDQTAQQPAAQNPPPTTGFVMPDWAYWVIGGVAVAAIAGVGYYYYKKRK